VAAPLDIEIKPQLPSMVYGKTCLLQAARVTYHKWFTHNSDTQ